MKAKTRVLAVDDDEEMLDLYSVELARLGFEVLTVPRGADLKAKVLKFKPDLILMDVMMPGVDGISLTRAIRSDPETRHIPVLVVSGLSDAAALNDALLFGALDYLVKPFDIDDLERKVERALAAAEKRRAKGAPTES